MAKKDQSSAPPTREETFRAVYEKLQETARDTNGNVLIASHLAQQLAIELTAREDGNPETALTIMEAAFAFHSDAMVQSMMVRQQARDAAQKPITDLAATATEMFKNLTPQGVEFMTLGGQLVAISPRQVAYVMDDPAEQTRRRIREGLGSLSTIGVNGETVRVVASYDSAARVLLAIGGSPQVQAAEPLPEPDAGDHS